LEVVNWAEAFGVIAAYSLEEGQVSLSLRNAVR
jgi:hypothetical protein